MKSGVFPIFLAGALLAGCGRAGEPSSDPAGDAGELPARDPGSGKDEGNPDTPRNSATYRVLSFNVLCSVCDPSFDPWEQRLAYFEDIFSRYRPDLIGLQEIMVPEEVDQVVAAADAGGTGPADPRFGALYYEGDQDYLPNPDATILYRLDRFDLVESGVYWLSPTPEVPWSKGLSEEQFLPRHVQWAHLRDRAVNRDLLFVTTHFDANHPAQENSAPLVLDRSGPWAAKMPVILTGDFNSEPDNGGYVTLTQGLDGQGFHFEDAYVLCPDPRTAANRDPPPSWDPARRIDHVFVAGGTWTCSEWVVDLFRYGPRDQAPSDHWPVFAEVRVEP